MCLFVLSKFPRVLLFFLHNPQTSTGRRCVRPRPRAATNWLEALQTKARRPLQKTLSGAGALAIASYPLLLHRIVSYCIVLHRIVRYCIVLHGIWEDPETRNTRSTHNCGLQNYFPPNQLMTWVAAEPNHCWKSWAGGRLLLGMAAFFQQSGGRSTRGCFYSQTK